jgi:hypothetical protein
MAAYEKILTSVLADVTITDAEYRLIGYLATRPPGWVVIPSAVARDLKRNERYWVWPALKLLLARGILTRTRDRGEHGQLGRVTFTINRDTIIASAQVAATDCETADGGSPVAVSQHVDNTLFDHALSNNSRVRTDSEVRTKRPSDQLPLTDVDAEFASFWAAYPRKVGKRGARSTYERALKHALPQVILAGTVRYRDDPNRLDEFTKHPSTWLNQGCWDDDPLPARSNVRPLRRPEPGDPDWAGHSAVDAFVDL